MWGMLLLAETAPPSLLDQLAQLGPVATGAAALVALIVGIGTLIQRGRADRREAWWKRAQWALDLAMDPDPARQAVGLRALQYLAVSKLAGADEVRMIEVAWAEPLAEAVGVEDTGDTTSAEEEGAG